MYSYFIICNTDDPSEFHIEMTTMRDYRLRFSAMKSNHIKKFGRCPPVSIHHSDKENLECVLPSYHNLLKKNYTYYLLEKREISSAEEALRLKTELIKCRSELFKENALMKRYPLLSCLVCSLTVTVVSNIIAGHERLSISPSASRDFLDFLVI